MRVRGPCGALTEPRECGLRGPGGKGMARGQLCGLGAGAGGRHPEALWPGQRRSGPMGGRPPVLMARQDCQPLLTRAATR